MTLWFCGKSVGSGAGTQGKRIRDGLTRAALKALRFKLHTHACVGWVGVGARVGDEPLILHCIVQRGRQSSQSHCSVYQVYQTTATNNSFPSWLGFSESRAEPTKDDEVKLRALETCAWTTSAHAPPSESIMSQIISAPFCTIIVAERSLKGQKAH